MCADVLEGYRVSQMAKEGQFCACIDIKYRDGANSILDIGQSWALIRSDDSEEAGSSRVVSIM